jgi:hypothetical protein
MVCNDCGCDLAGGRPLHRARNGLRCDVCEMLDTFDLITCSLDPGEECDLDPRLQWVSMWRGTRAGRAIQ